MTVDWTRPVADVSEFEERYLERQRLFNRAPIAVADDVMLEAVIVTGYSRRQLTMQARGDRNLSYSRHLAMFAMAEFARVGVMDIARAFHRDHSSVIAAIRRIRIEARTRAETKRDVEAFRSRLVRLAKESER